MSSIIKFMFQFLIISHVNISQSEWGPLRHVRIIKERNSGVSRGFAFIDFPSMVLMRVAEVSVTFII